MVVVVESSVGIKRFVCMAVVVVSGAGIKRVGCTLLWVQVRTRNLCLEQK